MPVEHTLPFNRNLLITTPKAIHLRAPTSNKTVFECESADGIVNASAAPDNSSLLAIADGHGVILLDTAHPRVRSHELKGSTDVPRLLLFAPDSQTLFFNTALNNSIQAYSLANGDLLPSSHPHPSPPSVLAISGDGGVLLSASSAPPIVLIQDRRWAGIAAVHFKPRETPSVVTCAAFEALPGVADPSSIRFVLGFKDGTLALYRVILGPFGQDQFPLADAQSSHYRLRTVSLGAMSKLHKAAMGGVTAAAFISGYTSRVVSIGHDGRCRLVDLERGGQKLRT
ncbi:hypothetical protein E8E12_001616 [Didymella heteroderae]|uniref:Uncharacterized protein n=1 Tax=Didymella heteroderae TaxID=1769908 RepID=A0A9P5BWI7_9PLEO|nr:hypothetical protein E8E12_001616 [Didymella heteroderae]